MKKLTKILSLVLVIAMVVSLCVVGASAKTFNDTDKVTANYKEAVDVLSDLGVVDGMNATTFAPNGNFTRAQACAIVARLTLGADVAKTLSASTKTFSDVATTYWGYNYIEYCANAGFVGGMGNGKFAPDSTLTGYQFALMLMRVIGVDTKDCTGANWAINTAKLYYATAFSNVAITNANITREAAVQMAYDGMFYSANAKTGYAVYLASDATKTPLGVYATVAEATMMANVLSGSTAGKYTVTATPVTVNSGKTLAGTVFGVTKGTGVDTFGRPATTYMTATAKQATAYGWDVANYSTAGKTFANVAVATYTTPVTFGMLYKTLGAAATFDKANSYTNGTANTVISTGNAVAVAKNDNTSVVGGNGILTEVYKTGTNAYVTVQVRYTLGEVAVSSRLATKTAGGYNAYTVAGNTNAYKVYTSVVDAETEVNTAEVKGAVVNGATALYVVLDADHDGAANDAGDYLYVEQPTTVEGVLTAVTSTGVMTIAGKTYNMSSAVGAVAPSVSTASQKFYVDQYGNVVKSFTSASTVNYGMALAKSTYTTLTDGKLVTVYNVTVALADGTTANLPVLDSTAYGNVTAGTTYTYVMATSGKYYTLTSVASQAAAISSRQTTLATGFTKGNATLSAGLYANASTKFVFANYKVDADTSARVPDGTVTVYTGINNVPTTTGTGLAVYALDTTATKDGIADVVYVFSDLKATVTSEYTYVIGTYTTTAEGKVYDTLVNGKASTVTVPANATGDSLVAKTLYSSITVSSTGVVTATAATACTSVQYKGGLMFVNDAYVATVGDAVPVYVYYAIDNTTTTTTMAAFANSITATSYGVVTDATGAVTAVNVVLPA